MAFRVWTIISTTFTNVLEILCSLGITLLVGPLFLLIWIFNQIGRLIVSLILRIKDPKVKLISSGSDGIWAYEKSGNSRNVIVFYVYNDLINFEEFVGNYEKRIMNYTRRENGPKIYDKLKKIFTQSYGYYCWKDSEAEFKLRNHLRCLDGSRIYTESDILEYFTELSKDMPLDRPQWEEIIVPRFRYDDAGDNDASVRSARIYRSHHAYMDGASTILMSGKCMYNSTAVDDVFPYQVDPLAASATFSSWKEFLHKSHCTIFGFWTIIRNIYSASKIKSRFLTRKYTGVHNYSWSEPFTLDLIKGIRKQTNASVPSILSSCILGAIRTLDQSYPQAQPYKPEKSIALGYVGALLPYPDMCPKNRFTVVNYSPSSLQEENRKKRLATTDDELRKLAQSPDVWVNFAVFEILGLFPSWVLQGMMNGAGTSALFSNVPWAKSTVKLWGNEVNDVGGWMPLLTTAGLGFSILSYNGRLRFCLLADEACLSKAELGFLINQIKNELLLLSQESNENSNPKPHHIILPIEQQNYGDYDKKQQNFSTVQID